MKIKLICLDMDGTLYTKDKTLLPTTIETMKLVTEQGVHIAIVSGRPLSYIMAFQKKISIDWIMAGANGAALSIQSKLITHTIAYEDIQKIISLVNKHHLYAFIKTQKTIYHNYASSELFAYDDITKDLPYEFQMHSVYTNDLHASIKAANLPFLKVIVLGDEETHVVACRSDIHEHMEVSTFSSDPHHFELTSKEADKGKAVRTIATQLQLSFEEICCIGDGDNDTPMFDVCAYPIAMENASDKLKKKSKFVTYSNNEDGVGHALEMLMEHKLI